jgi:hypothetical protein
MQIIYLVNYSQYLDRGNSYNHLAPPVKSPWLAAYVFCAGEVLNKKVQRRKTFHTTTKSHRYSIHILEYSCHQ